MKLRGFTPLLAASLVAVVFAAAGCGSKKSSSSTTAAAASTPTATTPTTTTAKKKTKATKLHAGQFCSTAKQSTYLAKGYTCAGGRLKKAGATTGTKTTPTTATTTTGTTTRKKAGQICGSTAARQQVYAKQHLKCVNGRLVKTQ